MKGGKMMLLCVVLLVAFVFSNANPDTNKARAYCGRHLAHAYSVICGTFKGNNDYVETDTDSKLGANDDKKDGTNAVLGTPKKYSFAEIIEKFCYEPAPIRELFDYC